jgi:hypothetical protein
MFLFDAIWPYLAIDVLRIFSPNMARPRVHDAPKALVTLFWILALAPKTGRNTPLRITESAEVI